MAAAAEGGAAAVCSCLWWTLKQIGLALKYLFDLLTSCVRAMPIGAVSTMLRVLNIGNACLLAATCVLSFIWSISPGPTLNVTQTFLAVYLGVFAVMLFIFETRLSCSVGVIRRNFGFMFTYMGRTIFLIFVAAVAFGMLDPSNSSSMQYSMCAGCGAGTLMNAFLNCIVICSHPGFAEMSKAEADAAGEPTDAGADPGKMSESQVKAYLAAHPELAKQALAGATAVPAQPGGAGGVGVPEWGNAGVASSKPAGGAPAKGGFFGSVFGGGAGSGSGGKSMTAAPGPAVPVMPAAPAPYVPPAVHSAPMHDVENPFGTAVGFAGAPGAAAPDAPPPGIAGEENPFAQ